MDEPNTRLCRVKICTQQKSSDDQLQNTRVINSKSVKIIGLIVLKFGKRVKFVEIDWRMILFQGAFLAGDAVQWQSCRLQEWHRQSAPPHPQALGHALWSGRHNGSAPTSSKDILSEADYHGRPQSCVCCALALAATARIPVETPACALRRSPSLCIIQPDSLLGTCNTKADA
jgi:hypothetical protein